MIGRGKEPGNRPTVVCPHIVRRITTFLHGKIGTNFVAWGIALNE